MHHSIDLPPLHLVFLWVLCCNRPNITFIFIFLSVKGYNKCYQRYIDVVNIANTAISAPLKDAPYHLISAVNMVTWAKWMKKSSYWCLQQISPERTLWSLWHLWWYKHFKLRLSFVSDREKMNRLDMSGTLFMQVFKWNLFIGMTEDWHVLTNAWHNSN